MSQSTLLQHSVDASEIGLKCGRFHAAEFSVVLKQTALILNPLKPFVRLRYAMYVTVNIIFIYIHFDTHSFDTVA